GRATARGLRGERADAASSPLRDGATDLVGADGGIAGGNVVGGTHGDSLRLRARGKGREALRLRPLRRVGFWGVLRRALVRVRDREDLRLERTRLFGRIRRIVRQLGLRFRDLGLLDDRGDIFYLELDEILALVEGRSTCTDIRGLAAIRRAEFTRYGSM